MTGHTPLALTVLAIAMAPEAAIAQTSPAATTSEELTVRPILSARARAEFVDQGALDADAVTLRVRAGAEAKQGPFALLVEGEATVAAISRYNAFPFPAFDLEQWRPVQAVVADPESLELNRLQIEYRGPRASLTGGRQRIDLDDQRWVGSVGWRQNEQTFDAIRGSAKIGPATVDLSYAISQRTIFGSDARPRTALDGEFVFVGVSAGNGVVSAKVFAYLLDYDDTFAFANSSQTYGAFVNANLPVAGSAKLGLRASYARQLDYGANPFDYGANYRSFDVTSKLAGFDLAAGIETLGSDRGRAVQTPMATLHRFNGWADVFLTTPPQGLQDLHLLLARKFPEAKALSGLNASIALHRFRSAGGDFAYGHEIDAAVGARIGKVAALIKYARYEARGFGADTRKLWLQLEFAL